MGNEALTITVSDLLEKGVGGVDSDGVRDGAVLRVHGGRGMYMTAGEWSVTRAPQDGGYVLDHMADNGETKHVTRDFLHAFIFDGSIEVVRAPRVCSEGASCL